MSEFYVDFASKLPPEVVDDYSLKRQNRNRKRNDEPSLFEYRDHFDDISHIVIATDGRHCLGSLRITPSEGGVPTLPMEQDGLLLNEMFPEYELENKYYIEIGSFMIGDAEKAFLFKNNIQFKLMKFSLEYVRKSSAVDYIFFLDRKHQRRLYRFLGKMFTYPTVEKSFDQRYAPSNLLTTGEYVIHAFTAQRNEYYVAAS